MQTSRPIPTSLLVLLLLCLILSACGDNAATAPPEACQPDANHPQIPQISERPFYMGFTRWPPAATMEGISRMNQFIASHADLTAIQFDGGVPWSEALHGDPLPANVINEWKSARAAIPPNHMLLISITPLNWERNGLAPYWGTATSQPQPSPWDGYTLDHPDVKTAYLNYARQVLDYFHPDYLAIGIEVNVAQVHAPNVWNAYKDLHRSIYTALKADYPDLPIFATFTNTHLIGLDGGDKMAQRGEIEALLPYVDLLGLSVYPYGWAYEDGKVDPPPVDFFATALSFGKPIGVTESGVPSKSLNVFGRSYEYTEDYQARWINFLLSQANEHRFWFVVNWAAIDFDELLEAMPPGEARDFARFWANTGLERTDKCPKKALTIWDAYLRLP